MILYFILISGGNQTEEFEKINPNKRVPAIDDNGFTLFERYRCQNLFFRVLIGYHESLLNADQQYILCPTAPCLPRASLWGKLYKKGR